MATENLKISQSELDLIRQTGGAGTKRRTSVVSILGRIGFVILVLIILFYTLFPFYWAIVSSLMPYRELVSADLKFWPESLTWSNYELVFADDRFMRALLNSAIISTVVVILSLVFGTLTAYAMARLNFRGRTFFLYLILSMTMFPGIAIIGSLFQMMRRFNAYDTLWGLAVVYLSFALPFTVWVLANFFRAMPAELEQAALVDGASPMVALRQVLLPLAVPGMVTTGLLAFIQAWSEFLYARTFTISSKSKTVQVAISEFTGNTQFEQPYGAKMAAAVVVTIPLIIGVMLVQRRIIAGMTAGAVKG